MPKRMSIAIRWTCIAITIAWVVASCLKLKPPVKPVAKFAYSRNCNGPGPCEVAFINQSENAESYYWKMGDGNTTVTKNPRHIYNNGVYHVVTLTAVGREDEASVTDTVFLFDKPACSVRGSWVCAKRLIADTAAIDFITPQQSTQYYFFSLPQPALVSIELKPVPAGGDLRIDLLQEANAFSPVITYATGRTGDVVKLIAGPLEKKEFYLKVSQWSPQINSQPYLLTYSPITTDRWELNNSFSTATPIALGQTLQGTIEAKGDNDYFVFNQPNAGVIDIKAMPAPRFSGNNRLVVAVYENASTTSFIKDLYRYPGETLLLSAGPLHKGTHYVRVYGTGEASSPDLYSLTISYDTSDRLEINNSFSEATPMTVGQTVRAAIRSTNDVDYYSFTATKTGIVTATVPVVPEGLPYLYLELYNAANSTSWLTRSYNYPGNPVTVSANISINQKYYVKVYSAGESNKQYEMKIQQ